VSIDSTSWHGLPAWALESDAMRAVTVPRMGAKIVSLQDRRGGFEWLPGPMPGRLPRPVTYGAPFAEQDMAGWDEMFPTILACAYPGPGPRHGAALPDHGEAWVLPWEVTQAVGEELVLAVTGRALPYRLTRSASFIAADELALRYTLENLGDDPMPYMWAAHPQFLAGADCRIVLPSEVTEVVNTAGLDAGWGPREGRFGWPEAAAPDGRRVRLDEVGSASLGTCRKFFALPDARPAWAEVRRVEAGHWLRLEWDPQSVPYLGLWVDEGAVNSEAVVAPEPMTGWYDELALAWSKGKVAVLLARDVQRWTLVVRVGVTMQDGKAGPNE
jgi:galactose mutarotase-like enzyme